MSAAVSPAAVDRFTPAQYTPYPRPDYGRAAMWSAAVAQCMQTLLGRLIEGLDQGLLVCDLRGRVLLETPALVRSLEAEPEHERLRATISQTVRTLIRLANSRPTPGVGEDVGAPVTFHELDTASARYRIRGSHLGPARVGTETETAVVVVLERTQQHLPLSDEALRERFRLTDRELAVARLLAQGQGNSDIAQTLTISPHTARRHTENVMLKLAVRSRAAVGAKLREG